MLVDRVLDRLLEIVHIPQVVLPCLVGQEQGQGLFELRHHGLTTCIAEFLQLNPQLHRPTCKSHRDPHRFLKTIRLSQPIAQMMQNRLNHGALATVQFLLHLSQQLLRQGKGLGILKILAATLRLNPKQTKAFQAQALKIPPVLGALNRFFDQISQRIHHIPVNPLPVEGIASPAVNDFPLGIHYIVVFQEAFAHPKIVFFDFLLGPLNRFGDHRMLNHLALFVPKTIHDVRNPFGTKEPHQIILQRNKENGRTRIPLTTCTTPQLPVHPP